LILLSLLFLLAWLITTDESTNDDNNETNHSGNPATDTTMSMKKGRNDNGFLTIEMLSIFHVENGVLDEVLCGQEPHIQGIIAFLARRDYEEMASKASIIVIAPSIKEPTVANLALYRSGQFLISK